MMHSTLITISVLISFSTLNGQHLKVWQNVLYYQKGEKFQEVKRFEKEIGLYGYGIVDSDNVFIVYQPEGVAEASSIIEIFNLSTNKSKIVGELGGTGESFFDYNVQNGYLVFNWVDGIAIMNLKNSLKDKSKLLPPKTIYKCEECSEIRWLNDSTIGFSVYEKEKRVFKKILFVK